MNYKMILQHIIGLLLCVDTLRNLFTVEIYNGLQSIMLLLTICYCVYLYMVYWDITKN